MKKNNSVQTWRIAKQLFEEYFDRPKEESLQHIATAQDIPEDVKQILIKLVNSQTDDDTKITEADLSFFNTLKQETPDLSGKIISNYLLLKRIGKGGMSQVYEAKRPAMDIQKHVAIKILHNHIDELDDVLKVLFIREQHILSKLHHPNIISLHHGGISDDGIPFLVMDYIDDAIVIDAYCEQQNLSTKKIVEIIRDLADVLNYAHNLLVVHKDIKPSNILVDLQGNLNIVDFGIATFQQLKLDKNAVSLQIYTPSYASPEQILNQNITPASDIFSLVAVMLALLTKQKPLPHNDIENYDPIAGEKHVSKLLNSANLDSDLGNIIKKGLRVDINSRYKSMRDLKSDLDNWLSLKPVIATERTTSYLLKKFIQRQKGISFLGLTLFVSIIIGIFSVVQQKNQAQLEALKAKQVTAFLIESIQASDPDLTKGKDVSVKELLQNAKLKIQESAFQDSQLSTALKQTIGTALYKIGQYQDAEQLLLQAIKADGNNFTARINLAGLYIEQKLFSQAQIQLEFLTEKKNKISKEDKINLQLAEVQMLIKQVDFARAEQKITDLIASLIATENIKLLIESKILYANIINETGNHQHAVQILEEALTISHKYFGEMSTTTTSISFRMADLLSNINPIPWERILNIFNDTIQLQIQLFGPDHPVVAKSYLKYGFALKASGNFAKSRKQSDLAKSIALKNFDESHILIAHINILLVQLNALTGDFATNIKLLNRSVETYSNHYGANHIETNQVKTTLAAYLLQSGDGVQALQILQPLYLSQKQQLGAANKATLYAQLNIIKALTLEKNFLKAIELGKQALKLSTKNLGEETIVTIGIQFALAEAYAGNENFKQAIGLYKPLLSTSLLKHNSIFDLKMSIALIRAYLKAGNNQDASLLINHLVDKYYHNSEKQDKNYHTLIQLQTQANHDL
ncbi:hypothetical protein MNBD_GAMMA01-2150 [hydrothermal vent metagenome]|uniref:Protein kinase domain-containing protein n=1 Tax=hydrothermal vent metagenome TaxID=652676 RepID=A0A3B0V1L6_9ZZZZ